LIFYFKFTDDTFFDLSVIGIANAYPSSNTCPTWLGMIDWNSKWSKCLQIAVIDNLPVWRPRVDLTNPTHVRYNK